MRKLIRLIHHSRKDCGLWLDPDCVISVCPVGENSALIRQAGNTSESRNLSMASGNADDIAEFINLHKDSGGDLCVIDLTADRGGPPPIRFDEWLKAKHESARELPESPLAYENPPADVHGGLMIMKAAAKGYAEQGGAGAL